jgi:hypothetical protein
MDSVRRKEKPVLRNFKKILATFPVCKMLAVSPKYIEE